MPRHPLRLDAGDVRPRPQKVQRLGDPPGPIRRGLDGARSPAQEEAQRLSPPASLSLLVRDKAQLTATRSDPQPALVGELGGRGSNRYIVVVR